ncbi:hypothetical protein M422DRAFT_255821 [Sphaerobolus stellatus SS14]|uniref:Uncharacterized protein n=1 Tax=Sphaerobolus stellatus (strain SS14) TaxID=990650 RepID=A0A0C9UE72_SPHS4|nr:hypothetical protein M422DRAFT_261988 [Sphaerobolus stellatus SS14]KIJ41313.1 hypothetical protein M422DRAFT_255821 [Sphaerobolus stellatus SS14]
MVFDRQHPEKLVCLKEYELAFAQEGDLIVKGEPGSGLTSYLLYAFLLNPTLSKPTILALNPRQWFLAHSTGLYAFHP